MQSADYSIQILTGAGRKSTLKNCVMLPEGITQLRGIMFQC